MIAILTNYFGFLYNQTQRQKKVVIQEMPIVPMERMMTHYQLPIKSYVGWFSSYQGMQGCDDSQHNRSYPNCCQILDMKMTIGAIGVWTSITQRSIPLHLSMQMDGRSKLYHESTSQSQKIFMFGCSIKTTISICRSTRKSGALFCLLFCYQLYVGREIQRGF